MYRHVDDKGVRDEIADGFKKYWNEQFPTVSPEEKAFDVVNKPPHYTSGKFEAIDIIEDTTEDLRGLKSFACGNALKYIIRHNKKGKPVEDLRKAIFYLNRLIEAYEDDGGMPF